MVAVGSPTIRAYCPWKHQRVPVRTIVHCNSSDSISRLHRRATILGRGNSANLLDSLRVSQRAARRTPSQYPGHRGTLMIQTK